MKKLPRVGRLGDILHKGFVLTCVGVTVYGMVNVSARIYNYLYVIKPQRLLEAAREQKLEPDSGEVADIATPLKA